MDVTAAAQDEEQHPRVWAGQVVGRTAKAAIVAALREEAG
jgi:hypothetical protein